MNTSSAKGNNPELWQKVLDALDEKLQLGLLDRLRRAASYHIEDKTLFIQAGTDEDQAYLKKSSTLHQLELLAQDAISVTTVTIKDR